MMSRRSWKAVAACWHQNHAPRVSSVSASKIDQRPFKGISARFGGSITASEGFLGSLQGSLRSGVVRAVIDPDHGNVVGLFRSPPGQQPVD